MTSVFLHFSVTTIASDSMHVKLQYVASWLVNVASFEEEPN